MLAFTSLFAAGFFQLFAGGAALLAGVAILLGVSVLAVSFAGLPILTSIGLLLAFNLGLAAALVGHALLADRF
ncbi:hypothetical protein [Pelagibacterium xiamenense]|uniref:hypothetical protein n=1 Tax=Pelagibacterium xiamenense TaxID=2901140 RepID=UPI001E4930AE|nr:hypothetical protein [Pelagibacterium xiamenense]MCD7058910.1 hypothetical protein [Pelagibacterium xiamenense]